MRILVVAAGGMGLHGLLEESPAEAGWRVNRAHNGRLAYDRLLRDTSFDGMPGLGVTVAPPLRTDRWLRSGSRRLPA